MILIKMLLVGGIAGIMSGLFGVGGGIVMVPAFIYAFKMDIQQAIGTSLLAIIPTALFGAWRHWGYGHVEFRTALIVGIMAACGAILGAYLTTKLPSSILQKLFALLLAGVAVNLFLKK